MHNAPRLGTTVSDASVAASTTFALATATDYRLAAIGQSIVCKFGAGPVAAADADTFVVSPNAPLVFNSDENTQLSVIEATAGATVSLTVLKKWGEA